MEIILGWFVLIPLAVIGGIIYLGAKLLGVIGGRASKDSAEEARMVQEIYAGMERLERRVDNLETLLLETRSKDGDHAR